MRPNLPKFEYVGDKKRFMEIVHSGHSDVQWLNPIDADTLQIQFSSKDDYSQQDLHSSVVGIGTISKVL